MQQGTLGQFLSGYMTDPCPLDCPNRKGKGKLDPVEVLLYVMLMIPVGLTIDDALIQRKLLFNDAVWRIGVLSAAAYAIRKGPTEMLYETLNQIQLGRNSQGD